MGRVWALVVRSRWSTDAGSYFIAVLATAVVLIRWLLDPGWAMASRSPGSAGPLQSPFAMAPTDPALLPPPLPCLLHLARRFPMDFDLSAGDMVRIGDDIVLAVLAVEDSLIRFGLESPEGCRVQTGAATELTSSRSEPGGN